LRNMSLDDIRKKIQITQFQTDYAVHRFRSKSKEEGWTMKRLRPRDPDEIKVLDHLARTAFRNAVKEGRVHYDKESRVLTVAEYLGSQKETT
jgi:hypothetical protein